MRDRDRMKEQEKAHPSLVLYLTVIFAVTPGKDIVVSLCPIFLEAAHEIKEDSPLHTSLTALKKLLVTQDFAKKSRMYVRSNLQVWQLDPADTSAVMLCGSDLYAR